MPLIKNQATAAATTADEIDKTATTQSTHKTKQKSNTANTTKTTTTTTTATTLSTSEFAKTTTATRNNSGSNSRQQQKPIKDTTPPSTKRRKHCYSNSSNNKHRKHKSSLAKSVPATPVQVNPSTTNNFVPSSPDFYDDDDNDDDDDDDVLYMPPYSYPNCSLNISNTDYNYENDNEFNFNAALQPQEFPPKQLIHEEQHFREAIADNHPFELKRTNEEDSSALAMITPPPPYDTPYSKQMQSYPYTSAPRYPQHQAAYTAPKAQRTHNAPHTRKYIFNNNREQFNISSSNGNSSSNSIHQQPQSTSLGSTLTNAITPTKLSAAAAAMFAAPQMVQLNRKWSNLHRKRRRRNSSSGDSKELDKLVLQSVDWDENDIY